MRSQTGRQIRMTEEPNSQYLFEVVDSDDYDAEPPLFIFFKREAETRDIPILIKPPETGWLWSADPDYPTEMESFGNIVPPSEVLEIQISHIMDDPVWRSAVSSDGDIDSVKPDMPIEDDVLKSFPHHEEYFLRMIERLVHEEMEFPPELQEYLLGIV